MNQPSCALRDQETFQFTAANLQAAQEIIHRYPDDWSASAVMPILTLAQRQNKGYLSPPVIRYVADYLKLPEIRVWEVATFYSMYNLNPIGRHLVQVCTTTPCWLRGSSKILQTCQTWLGIKTGETTRDGMFSLKEVECLAACSNAPVVQINETYYEDLTEESLIKIFEQLSEGKQPRGGSQIGRISSEGAKHAQT